MAVAGQRSPVDLRRLRLRDGRKARRLLAGTFQRFLHGGVIAGAGQSRKAGVVAIVIGLRNGLAWRDRLRRWRRQQIQGDGCVLAGLGEQIRNMKRGQAAAGRLAVEGF